MNIENQVFDVAIVGYGPTGATLANLLAKQGLQILVIDREAEIYNLPRAVHFDDETMRVFQTVGIADELSRYTTVNPGMKFQDQDGAELLDWPREQTITSHGWNASYRLHQPDLEMLLREQLQKSKRVHEELACQVVNIAEKANCIALSCKHKTTDQSTVFYARYVVGCDGANSLVRESICSDMKDFGFCARWLVVDVILKNPRPDLGDHSIQFCDSNRPMTYCRNPGARRRWEITLLDDEADDDITSDNKVWKFLSRWITQKDACIERKAVYTFRSAIARQWFKNRLCIAGDAAHLTPPFMGQGMCTGIRDAANLAWKLAAVLHKGADDSLLHSYQAERSPHAQSYIETAIRLGELITSMDKNVALQIASEQSGGKATIKSIQPKLGSSDFLPGINEQADHPIGRPFPQVYLQSAQSKFDDNVGYRHALITRERLLHTLPDDVVSVTAQGNPELQAELDKFNVEAMWVRPDRYVAAVSRSVDELLFKI